MIRLEVNKDELTQGWNWIDSGKMQDQTFWFVSIFIGVENGCIMHKFSF